MVRRLGFVFLGLALSFSAWGSDLPSGYQHIDPKRIVPRALLERAIKAYDNHPASFPNKDFIAVVDFSRPSNFPRLFMIDMMSGDVEALRTAHGSGGDRDDDGYVEELSNTPNSLMSSRGFYRVAEVYHGRFGRSVRLDGLSSTNSNARSRAIVIHGYDGMTETFAKQPMSWGCFALSWVVRDYVIDRLRDGGLLYADKSEFYRADGAMQYNEPFELTF